VKTPTTAEIQKCSGWFGAALRVAGTAKKIDAQKRLYSFVVLAI